MIKNDIGRRETIAKAHNVTSAIKKKLSEKSAESKIDLSNIVEKLADRRESAISKENK